MKMKMVEMKVDASELKGDESKLVEKLADFLKEKTGGDVSNDGKNSNSKGRRRSILKEIRTHNHQKILAQARANRNLQSYR